MATDSCPNGVSQRGQPHPPSLLLEPLSPRPPCRVLAALHLRLQLRNPLGPQLTVSPLPPSSLRRFRDRGLVVSLHSRSAIDQQLADRKIGNGH